MPQGNQHTGAGPVAAVVAPIPRIALTREEAAASLSMSIDSYERWVQPHVRMVRLGRMRLVPISELQRFVDEHAEHVLEAQR
jgi:hypothetical protein